MSQSTDHIPNLLALSLDSLNMGGNAAGAAEGQVAADQVVSNPVDATGQQVVVAEIVADAADQDKKPRGKTTKKTRGKRGPNTYMSAKTSSQINTAIKKVQDQQAVLSQKIIEAEEAVTAVNNEAAEKLGHPPYDFVFAEAKHIGVDVETVEGAEKFTVYYKAMAKAGTMLIAHAKDIQNHTAKGVLVKDLHHRYNKAHRDETLTKALRRPDSTQPDGHPRLVRQWMEDP
jgi:nitrogen regulatory protein PII-like uncharacterized protein